MSRRSHMPFPLRSLREALTSPASGLALLWDAVPLGLCLLTADSRVAFANRSAARLLHRTAGDCLHRSLTDLLGQRSN
ncbi:MAG: PAS domain-containing protein [Nitrospira sp.]|nr:PAS domain-containing protein [Nitrospira sp.]